MTVNVSATFKQDVREYNGLERIRDELVKDPHQRRVIAAIVETTKVTRDILDGGTETPTIRLVHVEAFDGEQAEQLREMLQAAFKERTGNPPEETLFDHQPPLEYGADDDVGDPVEDRRGDEA